MSDRRYTLIVFDWDGTLVDSATTIVECIQASSRDLGLPVPPDERASHVIGLGLHDSLRLAVPELSIERYPEFAAAYSRHFLAREARMRLFEGAHELLAELVDRGHRLAVATGKSRKGLDRALEANRIAHVFAASRCADETRPKPDPAMLHELTGLLGVARSQALMIGDTSHDLGMAASAGVDAVAVTYGAHPAAALVSLNPRGCVHSVSELRQWLMTHG